MYRGVPDDTRNKLLTYYLRIALSVPCCDLCTPELLDFTRPPAALASTRKSGTKVGVPHKPTLLALRQWRKDMRKRDFPHALFPASGILSDSAIETLASVGPITSLILLEEAMPGGNWEWFAQYGNELLDHMQTLAIPAMQPKPKPAPKTAKRPVDDESTVGVAAKRARTTRVSDQTTVAAPTPVTSTPSISGTRPPPPDVPQTPLTSLPQERRSTLPSAALANNPYSGHMNFGSSPYYRSYITSSPSPATFRQLQEPYYRPRTLLQPPSQPVFSQPTPISDPGPSSAP